MVYKVLLKKGEESEPVSLAELNILPPPPPPVIRASLGSKKASFLEKLHEKRIQMEEESIRKDRLMSLEKAEHEKRIESERIKKLQLQKEKELELQRLLKREEKAIIAHEKELQIEERIKKSIFEAKKKRIQEERKKRQLELGFVKQHIKKKVVDALHEIGLYKTPEEKEAEKKKKLKMILAEKKKIKESALAFNEEHMLVMEEKGLPKLLPLPALPDKIMPSLEVPEPTTALEESKKEESKGFLGMLHDIGIYKTEEEKAKEKKARLREISKKDRIVGKELSSMIAKLNLHIRKVEKHEALLETEEKSLLKLKEKDEQIIKSDLKEEDEIKQHLDGIKAKLREYRHLSARNETNLHDKINTLEEVYGQYKEKAISVRKDILAKLDDVRNLKEKIRKEEEEKNKLKAEEKYEMSEKAGIEKEKAKLRAKLMKEGRALEKAEAVEAADEKKIEELSKMLELRLPPISKAEKEILKGRSPEIEMPGEAEAFELPDLPELPEISKSAKSKKSKHGKRKQSSAEEEIFEAISMAKQPDIEVEVENDWLESQTEGKESGLPELPELPQLEEVVSSRKSKSSKAKKGRKSKAKEADFLETLETQFKPAENMQLELPELPVSGEEPKDETSAMLIRIQEAKDAVYNFDLEQARKIYLEVLQEYNQLETGKQQLVYEPLRDLFNERKSAEKLKVA